MGVVPTLASARWLRRTRVVALSSRHARLVALSYGLRDVSVVPPGVDTLLYHPPAAAVRASLRARLGVPSATFTWAVVGRVAPGKGVELAVRALAHLTPNEGVGDHLLVAGSGPSEPAIDALVSSLGLAHCITCAGDVKPPAAAYMCADALLFPTGHEESFGMAALEAMSCGVPVLARDRGAVPEVLAGNGVLVPSGEPRDWAAAMAGLRSDGARRTSSSIAGRRRAVEEYSHVKTVAALERLYVAAKAGAR